MDRNTQIVETSTDLDWSREVMYLESPAYLGRGRSGLVMKHLIVNRKNVARKYFRPNCLHNMELEREIMLELGDHPNIIKMVGYGKGWIDYEFCEKGDLATFIGSSEWESLTNQQFAQIIVGCLRGLEHIHKTLKKAHFDLKPSNILLTDKFEPKIIDLEDATSADQLKGLLGKPEYMPPEVNNGQETDLRLDVYSLGITFFELVYHRHPLIQDKNYWNFPIEKRMQLLKPNQKHPLKLERPSKPVQKHLCELILEMMEPSLSLRPTVARCISFLKIEEMQNEIEQLRLCRQTFEEGNRRQAETIKQQENQIRDLELKLKEREEQLQSYSACSSQISNSKRSSQSSLNQYNEQAWMQDEWKFSDRDILLISNIAHQLSLPHKVFEAVELAEMLRKNYLGKDYEVTRLCQQYLDLLTQQRATNVTGKALELLIICVLGITHSHKGAINLLCSYTVDGNPIRGKNTLDEHYTRMFKEGLIPHEFTQTHPFNEVSPVKKKSRERMTWDPEYLARAETDESDRLEKDVAQLSNSTASSTWASGGKTSMRQLGWQDRDFKMDPARLQAVREFGTSLQMEGDQVKGAIETADYLRLTRIAANPTMSTLVSNYLNNLNLSDGETDTGRHTQLLLIACIAIAQSACESARFLSEISYQGHPLRSKETLRKWISRNISLIPEILRP